MYSIARAYRHAPVGRKGVTELLNIVADPSDKRVSEAGGQGRTKLVIVRADEIEGIDKLVKLGSCRHG